MQVPKPLRRSLLSVGSGVLALAAFSAMGCRRAAQEPAARTDSGMQSYLVRGTVVSTTPAEATTSEVLLNHEAIPGLMGAMTMPYPVDAAVRGELHPGDRITASVQVDRTGGGINILGLKDVVVIAQAQPDYKPAMQYHVPAAGDAVPDFVLTNQAGRSVRFSQYKGKVLLLTFVYTRCPLADFCPRMSRNFAEIEKELAKDKTLYGETHLLSASFDPAYDTPAVLRSYGGAYTGRYTNETFAHWEFAVPSAAELPKIEQWFDLGVTPGPKGSWQHSLSTLVIGKDGKVVAFYPKGDWSVDEVLAEVRKAAAA